MKTLIICPDRQLSRNLELALADSGVSQLIRSMEQYPSTVDLNRFVRAHAPQIAFLSIEDLTQALAAAAQLEICAPGIQIVAVHASYESQLMLAVMRAGIREYVAMPFDRQVILAALSRIHDILEKQPVDRKATDLIYSFLPSKAGVGTSTIALNTAVAISHNQNTRTLLTDFDLSSGMVRFMLKLGNQFSLLDAAERSDDIDENFWLQLVSSFDALDVMHAGKLNPSFRMEAIQTRNVVDFARRNYKVIVADHSGNLEKYSVEVMHQSRRIFLVCTPEVSSIHLAREKYQYLKFLDLSDRVSVLLNRGHKRMLMSPQDIEELLGLPIEMTFPNDYQGVNKALIEGNPVNPASEFGKQCAVLGRSLLERKVEATERRKRFVEYFNITPARYTLESK